jgi:hypothetical protein
MAISADKMDQRLQGQTTLAQKVFVHVPVDDWKTAAQITTMMRQATQTQTDGRTIRGCLNALVKAGIVREQSNSYQRVHVRASINPSTQEELLPSIPKEDTMNKATIAPAAEEPVVKSPIDLCSSIATRLRDLANEIEELGVALDDRQQGDAKKLKLFERLSEVFKGEEH